ncbi:hypothetical protein Fmac_031723 [Flemingia macrophylla]|uniref:Uncharacterized protein n=1 Tax=Flemingia macrophylla TaxID=520843 RepID=A0ABD1L2V7_9FABA
MGCEAVVIDLDDYDVNENLKGCDSEDYRLERRWKRRELSNKRLRPNHFVSGAIRSSVKSFENPLTLTKKSGLTPEDEMDEDYRVFLVNYKPDIDIVSDDSNVDGSNNDINNDHDDHSDCDYRTYLDNSREAKRLRHETRLDTDNLRGLKQRAETGNQGSDSLRKQTSVPMKSHQNLETKRGPSKKRFREDVSGVPKSNSNSYSELDVDEDYQTYLNSSRIEDDYRPSESIQKRSRIVPNSQVSDYTLDTENLKGLKQRGETENQRSDSLRKQTSVPMKSHQNLEAKRGPSKKRSREDVSGVQSNGNSYSELDVDEDYQTYLNSIHIEDDNGPTESIQKRSVVPNSPVSDHAYVTPEVEHVLVPPEVLSVVDEDYKTFLNSVRIVNGEVEFMPERNTSKTNNMDDDDTNSSDSDLIVLEPNQIHENTPFVSSKAYDASWFESEKNSKDNWQFSANAHSLLFRRRLMNELQRPFNQEEYNRLLHEVRQKRQKERHIETRQGVVKSYRTKGVNKSYLEMYPDLAKALVQFKQPERVLFLLRGFVFWLQNMTHEGMFQPWLDKLCLERLWKM